MLSPQEIERFNNYHPRLRAWEKIWAKNETISLHTQLTFEQRRAVIPPQSKVYRDGGRNAMQMLLFIVPVLVGLFIVMSFGDLPDYYPPDWLAFCAVLVMVVYSLRKVWARWSDRGPSLQLQLNEKSIQLPPTGEFFWEHIADLRLLSYNNGATYLILLLRNGSIVEHRFKTLDEKWRVLKKPIDLYQLRDILSWYWLEYKRG
ncbi:MAG: hypothetical protein AAF433_18460 [Bacteroidota bacterium]